MSFPKSRRAAFVHGLWDPFSGTLRHHTQPFNCCRFRWWYWRYQCWWKDEFFDSIIPIIIVCIIIIWNGCIYLERDNVYTDGNIQQWICRHIQQNRPQCRYSIHIIIIIIIIQTETEELLFFWRAASSTFDISVDATKRHFLSSSSCCYKYKRVHQQKCLEILSHRDQTNTDMISLDGGSVFFRLFVVVRKRTRSPWLYRHKSAVRDESSGTEHRFLVFCHGESRSCRASDGIRRFIIAMITQMMRCSLLALGRFPEHGSLSVPDDVSRYGDMRVVISL